MTNSVLEELYAVRRQLMDAHGDNLAAFLHTEFEKLKAAGHPIADVKQKSILLNEFTKPGAAPERSISPRGVVNE